jgi:hypothetical protein
MPWTILNTTSSMAPVEPVPQTTESNMEASVNQAKPRLYMRTRPKMSPIRPTVTTRAATTSM